MNKVKIGVIGAGRIGLLHIKNILNYFSDRVKIKYVADTQISNQNKKWLLQSNLSLIKDPETIFSDSEITAVVICSPTSTHSDYITRAAERKKHIFCEKPIDLNPNKVIQTLKIVKKKQVHLLIGFNRRFDKNFIEIKKRIQKNQLKSIRSIKITSRDPHPPTSSYLKNSGGIFLDMSIHDFDMLDFLIPKKVKKVSTQGSALILPQLVNYNDIDVAFTTIIFEDGTLGLIDNSREAVYGYDQRIEILGEKGMLIAENEKNSTVQFFQKNNVQHATAPWFFLERYQHTYVKEFNFFFSNIISSKKKLLSGENALTSLLIALATQKSLLEKRTVAIKEIKF